jgi:hypothetical protein
VRPANVAFLAAKVALLSWSETRQSTQGRRHSPPARAAATRAILTPNCFEEKKMPHTVTAPIVFEREFLGIRSRLIEVGAAMDRIGRAAGYTGGNPRSDKIRQSVEVLLGNAANKAEQIQMLFSLPYDEDWHKPG